MANTSSTKSNAPAPRLPEKITLVDCMALHSSQEWQSREARRREVLVPAPPASRTTRETTLRVLREFMAQLDDFPELDEQDEPVRDHE